MRVLLVYPHSPQSIGRGHQSVRLAGKKAYLPPLGLITIAALLPQDWQYRLVDCTFDNVSEQAWRDADLVIVSGTVVQISGVLETIREAKRRGKIVAVGGPGVFHFREEALKAGADFVVLGEGEVTAPLLVEALRKQEYGIVIENLELADLESSVVPRFDLLDLDAYVDLTIQFSRGCPYRCEFCDVTLMFGRRVRTKKPAAVLRELETLYAIGWRRQIHFVDDNFVGSPLKAKAFLVELQQWMEAHGRPFQFYTYSSVLLGSFPDLLELLPAAGFIMVMLGIESTDKQTLKGAGKIHNTAVDLDEAVRRINRAGLQIMALTMIGFDQEPPGADTRIIDFATRNSIHEVGISLLQAFPGTRLWNRLKREGRLLESEDSNLGDWHNLEMNFAPSRHPLEIMQEFVQVHKVLYDPARYLERVYRHFANMKPESKAEGGPRFTMPNLYEIRALLITLVRQGLVLPSRAAFWRFFFKAIRNLSQKRFTLFVRECIKMEHYLERVQKLRSALLNRTIQDQSAATLKDPAA